MVGFHQSLLDYLVERGSQLRLLLGLNDSFSLLESVLQHSLLPHPWRVAWSLKRFRLDH